MTLGPNPDIGGHRKHEAEQIMHQVVAPRNAEERERQQVRQAFRKVFLQSAFCFSVWFHDWIDFLYLFLECAVEGVSERSDM